MLNRPACFSTIDSHKGKLLRGGCGLLIGHLQKIAVPAVLWCGSIMMLILVSGCGSYNGGSSAANGYQWSSIYRQDVHSVAVPIFTNRSFARGVEFQLTKALVSQLEAATPYKVVPRERADTILEGQITSVSMNPMSNDLRANLPQEQLILLRVDFTWKDLRSGRILAQQKDFEQAATYYPTLGEGRFVGTQQAVEELAAGIVQSLAGDW